MDHLTFDEGALHVETVPADRIAETFGTPVYVYSRATLLRHLSLVREAFAELEPLICFSVKALANVHVLRELAAAGSGVDVVSGGELHRALVAGVPAERIVFAGVGKSEPELRMAVEAEIHSINVESAGEMEVVGRVAAEVGKPVGVAVRVNPDVPLGELTLDRTTTGRRGDKFGVDLAQVPVVYTRIARHPWLRPAGLHHHLGSPIYNLKAFGAALDKVVALQQELTAAALPVPAINFGGGFPADYEGTGVPSWSEFARLAVPRLLPFVRAGGRVITEPGRSIAANAGILLARVRYVKQSGPRCVVVTDAGMSHFIRTALYDSHQFLWPTRPRGGQLPVARTADQTLPGLRTYDVVGPLCESSDYLARGRPLPEMVPGDVLAIFSAGAYGMTMSSHYNGIPRPAEVLVCDGEALLVRRHETYTDLVAPEIDLPVRSGITGSATRAEC